MPEGEQIPNILFSPDVGRTWVSSKNQAPIVDHCDPGKVRTVADALKKEFGWDYTKHDELMNRIPANIPERQEEEFGLALNKIWKSGVIPHFDKPANIKSIRTETTTENSVTYSIAVSFSGRGRPLRLRAGEKSASVKLTFDTRYLTYGAILSALAFDLRFGANGVYLLSNGNCLSSALSVSDRVALCGKFGFRFCGIDVVNDDTHKQINYRAKYANNQASEYLVHIVSVDLHSGVLEQKVEKWFSTVGKNYVKKLFTDKDGVTSFSVVNASNDLRMCRDYLESSDTPSIRQLQKISVPDMVDRHDKWMRARSKRLAREKKEKIKKLMRQITEHNHEGTCYWFGDGSRIIKLQSYDDYMVEGQIMEHCVESYYEYYEDTDVLEGIYSLRGPDGMPTATAEISKKYLSRDDARGNDDGWNHGWYDPQKNFLLFFDQIQAKRNSDPAQEDIEKFSEFLGFLNAVNIAGKR